MRATSISNPGASGSNFDSLDIGGNVSLAGGLEIDLTGGFVPVAGEPFEILSFDDGTLSGNFTSLDLPTVAGLNFEEIVDGHDIMIDVEASTSSTPEPASFVLPVFGLVACGVAYRRRKGSGGTSSASH